MSGIYGLWRLDGRPVAPDTLERMSEALSHRGPDGAHRWSHGPIGLGQCMLRTTPESAREHLPMVAPDRSLVLTADARIDNRVELIAVLGFRERSGEQISDGDLLFAAYERWGERFAEHLIGDFALVVWDARKQVLLCVRDHFGVKPLYYIHVPERLMAFASEIEALRTLPEWPGEIDDFEVARHLRVPLAGGDTSTTYYRNVRRVLPAHRLVVSDRGLEERSYWELDPTRERKFSSDDEYAEAFREVFVEAVRCRLRSVGPVASMLSGGLDSSAIACVAARLLDDSGGPPLHTLSAVYPEVSASDERSFIEAVLDRYEMIPHFFDAGKVSPVAEIDRVNRFVGGASWGPNLYLNWELFRIGADSGARVVLDGYDGDTTIPDGRGYLSELAIAGKWLKLALVAIPYSRIRGTPPVADYLALVRFGLRRRRGGPIGGALARLLRRRGEPEPGSNGSTPVWKLTIDEDFGRRFTDRIVKDPDPPSTEREIHRRKLGGQALLEGLGWIEACGAGRGVEVRFPFFDVRLVELCLSFPPDQKLRRGWTRFVMRESMEGILPPRIQWRPGKADLHDGWAHAFRSNENRRITALLDESDPRVERYVDIERLRTLHERFMAGETGPWEELALWRALSLALWLTRDPRMAPSVDGS